MMNTGDQDVHCSRYLPVTATFKAGESWLEPRNGRKPAERVIAGENAGDSVLKGPGKRHQHGTMAVVVYVGRCADHSGRFKYCSFLAESATGLASAPAFAVICRAMRQAASDMGITAYDCPSGYVEQMTTIMSAGFPAMQTLVSR